MSYCIDPDPIGGGGQVVRYEWNATIVLVGCGGTGSFLAEAICRLLLGRRAQLFLVDPDRVEPQNVSRQSFERSEIDRPKAQALAERLSRRFGCEVGYSLLPYDRELHARVFGGAPSRLRLLVGCVDNAAARRALADTLDAPTGSAGWGYGYGPPSARTGPWWMDCGNGRNGGQVLLGNAARPEALRGAFLPHLGVCRALPAPSLQRPDLLDAPPEPAPAPALDCAEAVAVGEQGGTINQVVAAVAASFLEHLLVGTCRWMAAYCDLDDGLLRFVPADPRGVAAIAGLPAQAVAPHVRPDRRRQPPAS